MRRAGASLDSDRRARPGNSLRRARSPVAPKSTTTWGATYSVGGAPVREPGAGYAMLSSLASNMGAIVTSRIGPVLVHTDNRLASRRATPDKYESGRAAEVEVLGRRGRPPWRRLVSGPERRRAPLDLGQRLRATGSEPLAPEDRRRTTHQQTPSRVRPKAELVANTDPPSHRRAVTPSAPTTATKRGSLRGASCHRATETAG